jgi:hypothetical protein
LDSDANVTVTYYDQLEKGTSITADNLRTAATNLGINRAAILFRYRLIDPERSPPWQRPSVAGRCPAP